MSLRNLSKKAFAESLEQLLVNMPIEKIRVTQIAKNAGATPQAFYYHFHDKYDLVAWIYLQDYAEIMYKNTQSFSSMQIMQLMMQFQKRKSFYQKVFIDKSQNAINDYAMEYNLALVKNAVELYQGKPMTVEQEIAILYHQYGVFNLFKDWIYDRVNMDIQQLAQFLYNRTPQFLKKALSNYHYEDL
ncbi:TPA: TetR/AcrR family transcriptional regulator C-terminal domain-containing protein [Staphylococcus aureus]|nr:TetR/AcrR family transcriptional regulator C-terminal domain-containing protein [Staphylococcus aureus]HDG8586566.1 TetR/AcrR family transcriptional regulator C-terminal domain-containing protein [Staphylococcus aureus]HDZ3299419.1 TetR/AcrR family transcriptional regulator C-terminal domain-containing protein [Staphylococcus aureus]HDZ3315740.1 TetR/AcrR family transcriptional regulator C-terminal domain-containing protein [Staphylococcus aureus]HDZ3340399.1 TetR/AcrR family transcriptional